MRKKSLYPGVREAEQERIRSSMQVEHDEEPDFIGMAPNYGKFEGVDPEQVMVWLNVD